MAVILNRQDEMRLRRAMENSPQNLRRKELQRRIEQAKNATEEKKRQSDNLFASWRNADLLLQILETIRDSCVPDKTDSAWSDNFSTAISMINATREDAKNHWLDYAFVKGGE